LFDKGEILHKIGTSVLDTIDVDYGNSSAMGYSFHNDGMPTEISLTLSFRETEVITKEKLNAKLVK
jgi:hypothetical protein